MGHLFPCQVHRGPGLFATLAKKLILASVPLATVLVPGRVTLNHSPLTRDRPTQPFLGEGAPALLPQVSVVIHHRMKCVKGLPEILLLAAVAPVPVEVGAGPIHDPGSLHYLLQEIGRAAVVGADGQGVAVRSRLRDAARVWGRRVTSAPALAVQPLLLPPRRAKHLTWVRRATRHQPVSGGERIRVPGPAEFGPPVPRAMH